MTYVTPATIKANPYGVSWTTFPTPGASQADQISAQLDLCQTVTSEMDTAANGILRAYVDLEDEFGPDQVITIQPNGWARFRFPANILQIVSARYCVASSNNPPSWTDIPVGAITTEHSITAPTGTIVPVGATSPNAILIAPGYIGWANGRKGYRVQAQAICGYPVAGIDQPAAAADTAIHVDDITGWYNADLAAGARGTIYDPPYRETVTCVGSTPDVAGEITGPGTLTLQVPLRFAHTPIIGETAVSDQKILVSTMPQALMQAGYYYATHFGLIRGASASIMQTGRGQVVSTGMETAKSWRDLAEKLIMRYGRVL